MSAISLRPATERDLPLIRGWLHHPDIQRWWGNASAAEAEVRLAFETPSALCRLICAGGEPVGYAQALDAHHWGGALPEGMPPGTWDADLFVAAAGHRGKGTGQIALRLLADEVFSTTLAVALSVFVSVANEKAIRAYEKAGFRWVQVWPDRISGPCWLMLMERPGR